MRLAHPASAQEAREDSQLRSPSSSRSAPVIRRPIGRRGPESPVLWPKHPARRSRCRRRRSARVRSRARVPRPGRFRRIARGGRCRSRHQEMVLHHDEEHRWCFDCHSAENRDKLRLASGDLVDFTESYTAVWPVPRRQVPRLARSAVHGRRSGEWNGTRPTCCACTAIPRTRPRSSRRRRCRRRSLRAAVGVAESARRRWPMTQTLAKPT
jgi:hypothetical protein